MVSRVRGICTKTRLLGLTDYFKGEMLALRYKSVNFREETSLFAGGLHGASILQKGRISNLFRAKREKLQRCEGLGPESQGRTLALTILYMPCAQVCTRERAYKSTSCRVKREQLQRIKDLHPNARTRICSRCALFVPSSLDSGPYTCLSLRERETSKRSEWSASPCS